MKTFTFLLILIVAPLSIASKNNSSTIQLSIDQVISSDRPSGDGIFRAILSNSEINPCIILESISLLKNEVEASTNLCPSDIIVLNYYSKGKNLKITDDYSGFFEEGTYFKNNILIFNFEIFLNKGASIQGHCEIEFTKYVIGSPRCKEGFKQI